MIKFRGIFRNLGFGRIFLVFLVWLIVLVLMNSGGAFSNSYLRAVVFPAKNFESWPIDEMVAGNRVRQGIDWLYSERPGPVDLGSEVCVDVFLGSFGTRQNQGFLALDILVEENRYRSIEDLCRVRDNAFHRFCYSGLTYDQIYEKDLYLELLNLDGKPGSSVTAIVTRDAYHGNALVDGVEVDGALRYKITTKRVSETRARDALGLVGIFVLLGVGLLFLVRTRPGK